MFGNSVLSGQRGVIVSIFFASLFLNILVLTAPLYMLQLFSRVMSSGSISTLVVLTIGAGIALLFYFMFDVIRQKLASRLGARLEAQHGPVVVSVLVQSASATDKRGAQPIRDLHELRKFVTGPAFTALLDAPWSVPFVGLIFLFHPLLGWIALAGIIGLIILGVLSELTGRRPTEHANTTGQAANALVEEMVRNADVARAMGRTPALVDRWQQSSFESMGASLTVVDRIAIYSGLARLLRMALQIGILGAGVTLVLSGDISPGIMIASSILVGRAAAPVEQSIAGWRSMLSARLAMKRLNHLLGAIEEGERKLDLPEPEGRISVENATIVVPEQQNPLIFDVSFQMRPGESLGIIGPSGSGKTTLARALAGLHPLSRGHIRVDDAAMADWPPEQLGRYIGFLPQRVELFDGTIGENIATMDENASSADIIEAAKRAEVHSLILGIPGGYNAPVGLRGELLSAGQRQRIALARAFYGDRKIVILDEPNANLDPDGEQALARAVENATQRGSVVIVVTHRPSILGRMTYSALMKNGRLDKFGLTREIMAAAARQMPDHHVHDDARVTTLNARRQKEAQEARVS